MSIKKLISRLPSNRELSQPKITEIREQANYQPIMGYDPHSMLEAYRSNLQKAEMRMKKIEDEITRLGHELKNTKIVADSMKEAVSVLSKVTGAKLVVSNERADRNMSDDRTLENMVDEIGKVASAERL